MEKTFPLRVVLSITTGRLLTKSQGERDNGIGDLYELLGHMTNDTPFTHQLPRFCEECRPWLLRWFPNLASANDRLDDLDNAIRDSESPEAAVESWLMELVREFGPTLSVPKIPADDHERKHPYDELVAMRGTDEGIEIVGVRSR